MRFTDQFELKFNMGGRPVLSACFALLSFGGAAAAAPSRYNHNDPPRAAVLRRHFISAWCGGKNIGENAIRHECHFILKVRKFTKTGLGQT
eukprot:COSAG06_NODE_6976_length_2690_cov_1.906986_2_plen_91_part_00